MWSSNRFCGTRGLCDPAGRCIRHECLVPLAGSERSPIAQVRASRGNRRPLRHINVDTRDRRFYLFILYMHYMFVCVSVSTRGGVRDQRSRSFCVGPQCQDRSRWSYDTRDGTLWESCLGTHCWKGTVSQTLPRQLMDREPRDTLLGPLRCCAFVEDVTFI
jgi:hypothetical protein